LVLKHGLLCGERNFMFLNENSFFLFALRLRNFMF